MGVHIKSGIKIEILDGKTGKSLHTINDESLTSTQHGLLDKVFDAVIGPIGARLSLYMVGLPERGIKEGWLSAVQSSCCCPGSFPFFYHWRDGKGRIAWCFFGHVILISRDFISSCGLARKL